MNEILGILLLAGVYFVGSLVRMVYLARVGKKIGLCTIPYEQQGAGTAKQILVLGDSTAYGTGAASNRYSIAGRLGTILPDARITNRSRNGLTSQELSDSITTSIEKKYDIIVIHIGANDVLRLKNIKKESQRSIQKILGYASTRAQKVIFYTSGKIGESPFFPWYIAPFMNRRSLQMRTIAQKISKLYENVFYIDLVVHGEDVFSKHVNISYSPDKLHPSSEGYGLWFERLLQEVDFVV